MLLDHLGIERAHVMGLSPGGRIAVDFALQHPGRVLKLIPVSPGLSGYDFDSPEETRFSEDMPGILEIGDLIEKNAAGSRKAVIKGAAHIVNLEQPEKFAKIVLEFLRK
jgi:pimeloyl-ACP methyl ester carboxylesterase